MSFEKFKPEKKVRLIGCNQLMTIVSVDLDAEKAVCKWTDPNVPEIHQKVFNLSDLRIAGLNINMAEIENAFATTPKVM